MFYAIVGLGFNIKFVLHQFNFVITGKLSAYLTTTDVKHSDVVRDFIETQHKKKILEINKQLNNFKN